MAARLLGSSCGSSQSSSSFTVAVETGEAAAAAACGEERGLLRCAPVAGWPL